MFPILRHFHIVTSLESHEYGFLSIIHINLLMALEVYARGPYHFPETSFHRFVILPKCNFTKSLFCRKKIAESHLTESSHGRIVELAKLHNAERHFSESLFSRTSFSRIVVQPNVIFTNRRSVERRFPVTSFARTSFCRNCMKQNVISPNTK